MLVKILLYCYYLDNSFINVFLFFKILRKILYINVSLSFKLLILRERDLLCKKKVLSFYKIYFITNLSFYYVFNKR